MKIRIDKIDVSRSENTLILYKNESIKRNEYGIELAIDQDGLVSQVSTLVSLPTNGFILSAHGAKHEFLQDNVGIGTQIKLDEKNLIVTIENDMKVKMNYLVNDLLDNIVSKYDYSKKTNLNVDYENALHSIEIIRKNSKNLSNIKSEIEFKKVEEIVNLEYEKAYQYLTISETLEARGVWHRPAESNLSEIIEMLDNLLSMNINDLYVEAFYHGFTIYPSKILRTHPATDNDYGKYGNDYLKALISEATIRDIEVHAWVENFFVGILEWTNSDLWQENPNWQIVNYNGLNYQTGKPGNEEEGFLFFDPANKEVQQFIIDFYKEMIELYDIKGLQLDYIRYPAGNIDYKLSSGYNEESVSKFKEINNLDVDIFEFVKEPQNYALWNQYRSDIITNFVENVYQEIMPLNPKLLFSIAVGPNASYAKQNLMQEWKSWVEKGWIDIVAPMAYVRSRNQIKKIVEDMNGITKGNTFNYTGVSPTFDKLSDIMNTHLIDESRKSNALGNVIFAYHNLRRNPSTREVLKRGTHRNKSIRPHGDIKKILINLINETDIELDYDNYEDTIISLNELKKVLINITDKVKNENELLKLKKVIEIVEIKIRRITLAGGLLND